MKSTENQKMDQLLHKTLDWKCKQCFRDQILSNQKPQENRCTVTDRLYELKKEDFSKGGGTSVHGLVFSVKLHS